MARSLGIIFSTKELEDKIAAVDVDGNGEIDLDEFKKMMREQQQKIAAEDGPPPKESPMSQRMSLSGLAARKKNTAKQMQWRTDKLGPGMVVSADGLTVSREGGSGWAVQLVDVPTSEVGFDESSVILECSVGDEYVSSSPPASISSPSLRSPSLRSPSLRSLSRCSPSLAARFSSHTPQPRRSCFVGVVSTNYNASSWNTPFDKSTHAVGSNSTGELFRKGRPVEVTKLCSLKPSRQSTLSGRDASTVQISLHMQELEMEMNVFDGEVQKGQAFISDIPVEVVVAVAFGPNGGKKQSVTLAGSSSEKTPKRFAKVSYGQDLWDPASVTLNPAASLLSAPRPVPATETRAQQSPGRTVLPPSESTPSLWSARASQPWPCHALPRRLRPSTPSWRDARRGRAATSRQ